MSFRVRFAALLVFLITAVSYPLTAQQTSVAATAGGATVHGMVVDPDTALIPNATVTLTPASGAAVKVQSKSDGTYTFRGVAPGTYSLTVTADGFASYVKEGVRIAAGANLSLDAKLAIMEQTQQMTVTANTTSVGVDPENNASSTVISGAALDALSDDPDELQSQLEALAGPSAGPNGGQIYIDGFTGGTLPPKSSIREIRINQNPFSAQFDQLGYGRVEVFTKPGTDKFHGNVGFQYNQKFLNTSTPFLGATNTQPDYHTDFLQGSVTGPIRTGMSFQISGNYRNILSNSIINPTAIYSSSPTSTTVCAPGDRTCSSNPYPTTARAVSNPQTRYEISPRLDMAIGAKNTVTARYQYETGSSTSNGGGNSLPSLGSTSSNGEQEIQISDSQLVSAKVINETRFEYQRSPSNSTPFNTGPSLNVQGTFSAGGQGGGSINNSLGTHIEVQNYTSIALAKNFIRLGGRLRTSNRTVSSNGGVNGSFTYQYLLDPCTDPNFVGTRPSACAANPVTCATPSVSSYQCGIASQYNITTVNALTLSARETDVGLYAEDDWKIKPNLTFSLGVRLEAQNAISSTHDFAPRMSIAYGIPRKSGKTTTVLRGGFGLFYDRFGLNNIFNDVQNNGINTISGVFAFPSTTCQPGVTGPSAGCPTATSPTGAVAVYAQGPGLRAPYTIQSAFTVEQQLGKYASVSTTYLNAHGEHEFLTRDFPNYAAQQLNFLYESGGVFRQNQININTNIRTPKGITIFGYYAASWANSNISGNPTNPYSTTVDYGRASFAVRSRMTVGGSIPLPYHISASPFITANSGQPYNITTGLDQNGDSVYNDRPAFASGVTASNVNCLNRASFVSPTPGTAYTQIPINLCTGPAVVSINLRLGRTFGFGPKTEAALAAAARAAAGGGPGGPGGFGGGPGGPGGPGGGGGRGGGGGGGGRGGGGGGGSNTGRKYNLTLGAQAMNLFNEVPYGNPVGTLSNARFGQTTSLQGFGTATAVRRIQLQANFSF